MGSKIGVISILFEGKKHDINIDYGNRTIGEIQEQLFNDFKLDKEFLGIYGICVN